MLFLSKVSHFEAASSIGLKILQELKKKTINSEEKWPKWNDNSVLAIKSSLTSLNRSSLPKANMTSSKPRPNVSFKPCRNRSGMQKPSLINYISK